MYEGALTERERELGCVATDTIPPKIESDRDQYCIHWEVCGIDFCHSVDCLHYEKATDRKAEP